MNGPVRLTALLTVVALSAVGFLAYGFENRLSVGLYAKSPGQNLYDPDPNHLWNRLYRELYVRTGPDGQEYGYDEVDPPLWYQTSYLLTEPSHRQAIDLLDEFLSRHGENLVADPLKRAMLQRNLWAVFDWSASRTDEYKIQRRELEIRLAQAIQRLALTSSEIAGLPDNYASAVASNAFPTEYQAQQPSAGFLPKDLLASDTSSWVCLGGVYGELAAPTHFHAFGGRSAFLVFMRLPGGREATLDYLEKLRKASVQFPAGTQVALVRQMMLVDSEGELTPTGLTETVQFRVFRGEPGSVATAAQGFYKFKLSQAGLFAGEAGGLRQMARDEKEITIFAVHGMDWELRKELQMCHGCHGRPGADSLLSYRDPVFGRSAVRPADQVSMSVYSKRQQYSWGLLQGMWQ